MRSTTIVSISVYCFVIATYALSLAVNAIGGDKAGLASTDLCLWLPVAALTIFAGGFISVGVGIFNLNQLCWKVLFFSLAICVSSAASLTIVFLFFLWMGIGLLVPYFQTIHTTSAEWFSFLAVFLSEIIVLYYLTREEIVDSFGDMDLLISPF